MDDFLEPLIPSFPQKKTHFNALPIFWMDGAVRDRTSNVLALADVRETVLRCAESMEKRKNPN